MNQSCFNTLAFCNPEIQGIAKIVCEGKSRGKTHKTIQCVKGCLKERKKKKKKKKIPYYKEQIYILEMKFEWF